MKGHVTFRYRHVIEVEGEDEDDCIDKACQMESECSDTQWLSELEYEDCDFEEKEG